MATIAATKQAVIDQINAKAGTASSKDTIFLAKALKEASNAIDVGTNGQVLKTNAAATGVEWATDGGLPAGGSTGQVVTNTTAGVGTWQTPAAGGKMLQSRIYQWTDATTSTTSNIPVLAGTSFTFTPTSASSTLIFQLQSAFYCDRSNAALAHIHLSITKDSTTGNSTTDTVLWNEDGVIHGSGTDQQSTSNTKTGRLIVTSTAAITFRVYFWSQTGHTCWFNHTTYSNGKKPMLLITEHDCSTTNV
jgi:hypothetical protein